MRSALLAPVLAAVLILIVAVSAAPAVGPNGVAYVGETDQGLEVKLVTDRDGAVKRGAFSARTRCSGNYRRFTGDFAFRAPLDRSRPGRFRDHGSRVESDATHSARYKWEVAGKRKGRRKIAGRFSVEIVFRRNGREYVTCKAKDVAYTVKRSRRRG